MKNNEFLLNCFIKTLGKTQLENRIYLSENVTLKHLISINELNKESNEIIQFLSLYIDDSDVQVNEKYDNSNADGVVGVIYDCSDAAAIQVNKRSKYSSVDFDSSYPTKRSNYSYASKAFFQNDNNTLIKPGNISKKINTVQTNIKYPSLAKKGNNIVKEAKHQASITFTKPTKTIPISAMLTNSSNPSTKDKNLYTQTYLNNETKLHSCQNPKHSRTQSQPQVQDNIDRDNRNARFLCQVGGIDYKFSFMNRVPKEIIPYDQFSKEFNKNLHKIDEKISKADSQFAENQKRCSNMKLSGTFSFTEEDSKKKLKILSPLSQCIQAKQPCNDDIAIDPVEKDKKSEISDMNISNDEIKKDEGFLFKCEKIHDTIKNPIIQLVESTLFKLSKYDRKSIMSSKKMLSIRNIPSIPSIKKKTSSDQLEKNISQFVDSIFIKHEASISEEDKKHYNLLQISSTFVSSLFKKSKNNENKIIKKVSEFIDTIIMNAEVFIKESKTMNKTYTENNDINKIIVMFVDSVFNKPLAYNNDNINHLVKKFINEVLSRERNVGLESNLKISKDFVSCILKNIKINKEDNNIFVCKHFINDILAKTSNKTNESNNILSISKNFVNDILKKVKQSQENCNILACKQFVMDILSKVRNNNYDCNLKISKDFVNDILQKRKYKEESNNTYICSKFVKDILTKVTNKINSSDSTNSYHLISKLFICDILKNIKKNKENNEIIISKKFVSDILIKVQIKTNNDNLFSLVKRFINKILSKPPQTDYNLIAKQFITELLSKVYKKDFDYNQVSKAFVSDILTNTNNQYINNDLKIAKKFVQDIINKITTKVDLFSLSQSFVENILSRVLSITSVKENNFEKLVKSFVSSCLEKPLNNKNDYLKQKVSNFINDILTNSKINKVENELSLTKLFVKSILYKNNTNINTNVSITKAFINDILSKAVVANKDINYLSIAKIFTNDILNNISNKSNNSDFTLVQNFINSILIRNNNNSLNLTFNNEENSLIQNTFISSNEDMEKILNLTISPIKQSKINQTSNFIYASPLKKDKDSRKSSNSNKSNKSKGKIRIKIKEKIIECGLADNSKINLNEFRSSKNDMFLKKATEKFFNEVYSYAEDKNSKK